MYRYPKTGSWIQTFKVVKKQGSDGKTSWNGHKSDVPMGMKITPGEGLFITIMLMLGWG